MHRKFIALVFLLSLAIAWGQSYDLYVLNQHFNGKMTIESHELYAEIVPLFQILHLTASDISKDKVTFQRSSKEYVLPVILKKNVALISVKQVAKALDMRFQYNSETKIFDLFVVHNAPPTASAVNSNNRSSQSSFEVVKTEEQKGMDEIVVYVTVQNKGEAAANAIVTCNFKDEDGHPLETQNQRTPSVAPGSSSMVYFKMVYPKASNNDSYRDYNTRIHYDISVSGQ